MKIRPITMTRNNGDWVHSGRKTNTRRGAFIPETHESEIKVVRLDPFGTVATATVESVDSRKPYRWVFECPYGAIGDRLWVREPWAVRPQYDDLRPSALPAAAARYNREMPLVFYNQKPSEIDGIGKARSPRFMPKWACRTHLEIVDIRLERINDITYADALREGVRVHESGVPGMYEVDTGDNDFLEFSDRWSAGVQGYRKIWESIYTSGQWDNGPFVWSIHFHRVNVL